jgi:hypothetical protein
MSERPNFINIEMQGGSIEPGLQISDSVLLALHGGRRDVVNPLNEYEQKVIDFLKTVDGIKIVEKGLNSSNQTMLPIGSYRENGADWLAPATIRMNNKGQIIVDLHYF